jgi:HNH endonuclease
MSTEISQALLKSRFTYTAGFLYKEGKKIGLCPDKNGYGKLTIKVEGKNFYMRTHRAIFLFYHGYLPEIVDHINGVVTDNRVENLRSSTKNQNQWNRKNNIKSATGRRGVVLKDGRYCASCKVNNTRHHLGSFDTLEEAETVLKAFRLENHKEFANND